MKSSFTQNYFNINNGYLSHNGGLGSQYSSLNQGEYVDYDEFMKSMHSLEGNHDSGVSAGMQNSQAMIEDLDNSKTIMPVSDNVRMSFAQKVNVQSSGIVRENITSLQGVVVHPAIYTYANGRNVKINTLEKLKNSELADVAMVYGRSWVAGRGYALDTYDPYFLDFYEGGRNAADPSKRESNLYSCLIIFSLIMASLSYSACSFYNISDTWVLFTLIVVICIGVGYISHEINADHEKNRKFTMEMITYYLQKDESIGFTVENNLSEENAVDEFYTYCPMCYAARIENETTCICCGASLKQSS